MSWIDGFSQGETEQRVMQAERITPSASLLVPVASHVLISRDRLNVLLDESFKYPLTLVSAPAGFGKTTLVANWAQSLSAKDLRLSWVSLDEEHNEPRFFWTYLLAALNRHLPERFTSLLMQLYSSQAFPLKYTLKALINLLVESTERFVLILDDYHLISEQQVHISLSYMVNHLPPQLRIILVTREDPPLPLPLLQSHQQVLEIRTNQLRCTAEETKSFFQEVMGIQLPEKTIQAVTARTEGWLVGLQLLGLSLPGLADPASLLEEASGDQRYILDYLTEEVLQRQPQEVQNFLLCTCILERLTASLCDAVMQQVGSQQMLERLEQANLFVVSLDNKREWYRYHALFAEALCSQLEQRHADLVPLLHHRASLWYAEHGQITQAILHAFSAHQWHWAADLVEREYLLLVSFTWGAGRYTLVQLRQWLEQLPADIMACRPRLCLACTHLLWTITPHALLSIWLNMAEAALMASLKEQTLAEVSQVSYSPQAQQEQVDLLGEVLTIRTLLQGFQKDGQTALVLGEQAQALLSPENAAFRAIVAIAKTVASYSSSANDAVAAIACGYQAILLAQGAGQPAVALCMRASTIIPLIGAGRLHEAEQLTQQALLQETLSGGPRLPERGWMMILQAEMLRERNELACARALATEAISLCEQSIALVSVFLLYWGYAVLVRVSLSCGDLDAAGTFLQQAEQIGQSMNLQLYQYVHSCFTTIDQVRLWLACGELDRATHWIEGLNVIEHTPFAREREEVACARIFLAKDQPTQALQRLEPVLQRASAGQRWGHVIEIRVLQALAHQQLHEEPQALEALSEAVRLGEPEGYMRSFVEEGTPMAVLLSKLREEQRKVGPTPYLDRVLAAFPQPSKAKRVGHQTQTQPLPDPLSQREREVLQLLARGASNQEIGRELVIAINTVKRHVSHIFAKLGVQNRVQAARCAQEHGMLDE